MFKGCRCAYLCVHVSLRVFEKNFGCCMRQKVADPKKWKNLLLGERYSKHLKSVEKAKKWKLFKFAIISLEKKIAGTCTRSMQFSFVFFAFLQKELVSEISFHSLFHKKKTKCHCNNLRSEDKKVSRKKFCRAIQT